MLQNAQVKNAKMTVLSVDNVWTAEFAANGIIRELPADQFPTDTFLKAPAASATYFDKLYAYPYQTDGGLLYYRSDLLKKYDLEAPTTWAEMKAACTDDPGRREECQALLLWRSVPEVRGAHLQLRRGDQLRRRCDHRRLRQAQRQHAGGDQGLQLPHRRVQGRHHPEGRDHLARKRRAGSAFQNGELIFLRNWAYVYNLHQKTDGRVEGGRQGSRVAPLPGLDGPGVSTLGGHNLAIGAYAANKGTAVDFIKFMSSDEAAKSDTLATGQAHVNKALYSDPEVLKKFPHFPILLKSIETAIPRPKVVKYGDATQAMQDAAYAALQGQTSRRRGRSATCRASSKRLTQ